MSKHTTAVLIFARSGQQDAEHKGLLRGERFFNTLTQETLKKVKRSKLPYFHFTEAEQQGHSFGERFVNAIEAVYAQGYDAVITIGNDSPQLKTSHLLNAEAQLRHGNTVLGPTFDGGFYLMGLHKSNFNAQLLLRLPWQRFGLFNRITQLLQTAGAGIFRLPTLAEVDSQADLLILANFVKTTPLYLRSLINSMLSKGLEELFEPLESTIKAFTRSLNNKGSPFFYTLG